MNRNGGQAAEMTAPSRWQTWKQDFTTWVKGGFVPEPIAAWQWFLMRLGFAALVLWTFWDWHPYRLSTQSTPVGLARWVDLTWLHAAGTPITWVPNAGLYEEVFLGAAVLAALYVIGIGLRWVLPLLAVAHVLVWTFYNSQGYTYHGMQMISLVILGQAIVVWCWHGRSAEVMRARMWFYCRGIILVGYVTSVLTKITNSKGLWLWNSKYLSVELIKSHRLSYYKDLEPEMAGDPPSAHFLLEHPYVAQLIFGLGFFVELFAWLGLRDRKWSCIVGVAIILMHLSITWLMRLSFTNHQILCFIFLVNAPALLALAVVRLRSPAAATLPAR